MNRRQEDVVRAARALGATGRDVAEMRRADLDGITPREAARMLGEEKYRDRRNRERLAGPWRWDLLTRFASQTARTRLVRLLERELTGREIDLPPEVAEAVANLQAFDEKQRPDAPRVYGQAARHEYERLAARERKAA